MQSIRTITHSLVLAGLSLSLLLAACGQAAVQTAALDTAVPTAAATELPPTPEPSSTPVPPTAASAPTSTPTTAATATETAAPSETPTVAPTFGAAGDGLSAWCLPQGSLLSQASDPASPPENALLGEFVNGEYEINNLPVFACVFTYTFNQPPPAGLKLEVYDRNQKTPWLTADLQPVESNPKAVATLLRHTYIVEPPLWQVSYEFAVRDGQGAEVRRDVVNLNRWTPELCWNGRWPNPITLRCPLPQDLHPWDPSYGTPIPTFPPEGE